MLQFHLVKFPSKFSANFNQISRKPAIQRFSFRCGWMNRWIHIHSILMGILIVIKDSGALNKQSYIARKIFPGVKTLLPILQEQYRPHHDFSCRCWSFICWDIVFKHLTAHKSSLHIKLNRVEMIPWHPKNKKSYWDSMKKSSFGNDGAEEKIRLRLL